MYKRQDQNSRGGRRIAKAVGCVGLHGCRVYLTAQAAIETAHEELGPDGDGQYDCREDVEVYGPGVEYLADRALGQLDTHQQDGQGDKKAREILDAPVAEGMVLVGLLL